LGKALTLNFPGSDCGLESLSGHPKMTRMPDRFSKRQDDRLRRLMLDPESLFHGVGKFAIFDYQNDAAKDIRVSRDEVLKLMMGDGAA
jgi:hypothetical protein